MSIRPELTGMTADQIKYVEELEKIANALSNNGAIDLVAALNEQLSKLATQVRELNINITFLGDKDDKTLDRFIKLAEVGPKVLSSYKTFTQEYGVQEKKDDEKSVPLMERLVRKNRKNESNKS